MVAYSFKQRFVVPIEVGLGKTPTFDLPVWPAPKLQTIRAHRKGKGRHARPGEVLQLYYAMRTSMCRLIGVAKCVSVDAIRIEVGSIKGCVGVTLDGVALRRKAIDAFAKQDGFDDVEQMRMFWMSNHPGVVESGFDGVVIRWAPITGEA